MAGEAEADTRKIWEGFDELSTQEKEGVIQTLKGNLEEKLEGTDPQVREVLMDGWESMLRVAAGVPKTPDTQEE